MHNGRTVSIASHFGIPVSELDSVLEDWILVGAEGEGEGGGGEGAGGVGVQDPPNPPEGEGEEEGEGEGEGEPKVYDEAYVKKLRQEAADNRIKAKAATDELDKIKKAEMDDLERAKTERDEEKQAREAVEKELAHLRMSSAIERAALSANFHDPQDAMSLIDLTTISTNDEGLPNKQSVDAAVKRLAESKPHLVKPQGPGSGDGSARGLGAGKVGDKKQQYSEEFQRKGGVLKPQ